jgi:membrane protease YdiL (CAAX protease family)
MDQKQNLLVVDPLLKSSHTNQSLFLELIQLSPILVVFTVLWPTNDALLTLFVFHALSMIGLPWLYSKVYDVDIRTPLIPAMGNMGKQILIGTFFGTLSAVVVPMIFDFYLDTFGFIKVTTAKIPLQYNWIYLLTFFFQFTIINPIVEEVFWRYFIGNLVGKTQYNKMILSAHFGLYHFFVVDYVMRDAMLSLVCAVVITGLGRILHEIRDRFGLVAAILAHLGGDAGICACVYQVAMHFMK